MGIYNKVYLGHVETINTTGIKNDVYIEPKVVALKLVDYDYSTKMPKFRPLRNYNEYYKIINVEPLNGYVSDSMIDKAIKNTGKQEVKKI